EIKRSVGELKTAKEKCPLCNADLTPEHKSELLEDFSQKIRKNEKLIHTVEKKIQGYKNAKLRLEKFKRKLEGINLELLKSKIDEKVRMEEGIKKREIEIVEIKKYLEETELLKKELVETEKRKNMLEEKNEGYIGARQFLRKNRPEKEGIKLEIEKLENKIRGLQEKIDKIIKKVGYKPEISLELERLKKDKRRLLNELTELEKAKSRNGSVIEEKERSTKNRKNELKELKDKREDLKKLEEFKVLLARIRGFFHKDVLQKELRVRSKPLVESYTRDVFDSFDLPYSDIALTDDFDLIVYGPLGEESSEMLSGGERIASALALRIGIAKALSGSAMELIILDEPTTHLDIIRRRDLVDIIKRLSSIPQTIVVTHDKEFENAADTMIEVEKIEGVSRVRYVD
ncbi:MAG: AAA family ATPase, partial [Candidatus Hydrothermarchaeales archaeon]